MQLHIYVKAVRILVKGYLPILLITPLKLKEILKSVKDTLTKTNLDCDIIIKRLHLYYYMKLVTFRIDRNRNLIIPNFHATVHAAAINIIPIGNSPITNCRQNTKADSYTQLQIKKPSLALHTETYINTRQQQLATCKRIGYEFFCSKT